MSPGPTHQRERQERKEALANDRKLRPGDYEASTLHAMANLGIDTDISSGRSKGDYVAGSEPHVSYPAASGPWSDSVRVPDEPPLGYPIDAQEPVGTFAEVQASLSAAGASADAGRAEVAAPTLAATPSAEVVERTSATSLISSASASPAGDGDGVGHNHSIVRTPSPTLHRPVRRL